MQPKDLTSESFRRYPPQGRALAAANLALLQSLPPVFVPFLLKEIIGFDWKFPVEQDELTQQFAYLKQNQAMGQFAAIQLNEKLAEFDWVNAPAQFLEQLSAHLWATHQMDGFRSASEKYVGDFHASLKPPPLPAARLGIVVFGETVETTQYRLFRKLRSRGVVYSQVKPQGGLEAIAQVLRDRAEKYPAPYSHWWVDGSSVATSLPGFTSVSYDKLTPIRGKLAAIMMKAYGAAKFDPEGLRSTLAAVTPETVDMADSGDATLDRFQLSLLTEGSGTQIYSTTFVQWAAREILRRAQPLTLYTRYAPRQKERTMDELLSRVEKKTAVDAHGSMIDGDMGAYYTWINLQRLRDADSARFLVWFENHGAALVITPGCKAGTDVTTSIDMAGLLAHTLA